jgi:hypothetical protein
MKAFVARYRGADGACVHGIVFEGRTRLHLVTSQPDVRVVTIAESERRFVTELERPTLSKALRDLGGARKRNGISKGAKALLDRAKESRAADAERIRRIAGDRVNHARAAADFEQWLEAGS